MDQVAIEIKGASGGKESQSRNPVEAPNNLFSVAFAKVLYLLSEGEIQGFANADNPEGVDGQLDIYLDGTPIRRIVQNVNTQLEETRTNFQNVQTAFTPGTPTQSPLSVSYRDRAGVIQTARFDTVENTVGVNTSVFKDTGPITRTIVDSNIERLRVIIQHPSLQAINSSNGDVNPTTVQYRIGLSANGGPFVYQGGDANGIITVSGKSSGQFQRAYEFALTGTPPWTVQVERLTDDSTSGLVSSQIVWQAYTEIVDEKLSYPNSSLLGVRVDARQFSNIPDVKVRLKGKKVEVPTIYDPETRIYSGLWDGSWKTAWTDNPAWILRDLVVNPVYGVRRYLKTADVDPWYLLSCAKYCDELVPDGNGGQEPRFRCNVYLQNEGGVFDVLNAIASVMRGIIYHAEGKLFVSQDRPAIPVQQFSEANVIQDVDENGRVTQPAFVYQGTSRTARKSVILASWDDPSQDYNQVSEYLQDDELLRRYGYNPADLRLMGCTSRGQSLRAAKFALFANRYFVDKLSFRVGAEGLAASIGEVIQVADPNRQGQRLGGRIKEVNGNQVTLDMAFTPQVGVTYTLTLVDPDGAISDDGSDRVGPALSTYTVTSFDTAILSQEFVISADSGIISTDEGFFLEAGIPAQGTTVLTLDSTVTASTGSLWVLEWQDLQAALYRIISISESGPLQFQVEALPYNDSSYSYIDNDTAIAIPKTTFTIRDAQPPSVLNAWLEYRNGSVRIQANWIAPQVDGVDDTQVLGYQVSWRQVGAETWSDSIETSYTDATISVPQFIAGTQLEIRVASRNRLGQQSNWLEVAVADLPPLPDLSDPSYNASVSHQNQPDGTQLLLISTGTVPLVERLKGFAVWAKPRDQDKAMPGVKAPNADGWYLLSDEVPLSGYYTMAFHLPLTYDIRVALTSFVAGENPSDYIYDVVYRDEIAPPAPERFTVVESQDSALKRFSWLLPRSSYGSWLDGVVSDIRGYEIRYYQGTLGTTDVLTAWNYGIELYSGGVPATQTWFDTALFDQGEWTVMIRSTDATGWQSDDIAFVTLGVGIPLVQNVVETGSLVVDAAGNGFDNCEVITPGVGAKYVRQIDPTRDARFVWSFDNNNLESALRLTTDAVATFQHFIGAGIGADMPILAEDGTEIWAEDGTPILAEQPDLSAVAAGSSASAVFHPYAPLEKLTEDTYIVSTLLRSLDGTTKAILNGVDYELDYQDILETLNNQSIAATTGTTINLSKPFTAVKSVQVTLQSSVGSTAISAIVTAKSTTSVTIKCLDSSGVAVAGLVDVTVQGY